VQPVIGAAGQGAAGPRIEPQRVAAPLPSAAATLRVNAETLDHLINESGEVAIARSRVEAELRTVKQALSDLNDASPASAAKLREARCRPTARCNRGCRWPGEGPRVRSLEFDRYTRLQELTRMMAEGLKTDITSIQQALFQERRDTDARCCTRRASAAKCSRT